MLLTEDVLKMLADVSHRLEDDVSLDVLATKSGLSRFHFHRGFRQAVGETPKQYTQRLRLERAAALLATGSDSILSIALTVGFVSHEVFVRAFRRSYSCTPTQYRIRVQRRVAAGEIELTANLIRTVGPCVRFFHASQNQPQGTLDMPTLEIERREVEPQPILFIQRRVARTQLQPLFAECFPKLYGHCVQTGLAMAGQPIARYVSSGTGLWTIDCAIPIVEPASGEGEMQPGQLQTGPAAFAVHAGPYERLPGSYAEVEQWIENNGMRVNGPAWEIYVTDPAEYADPSDWRTEIYWPVSE